MATIIQRGDKWRVQIRMRGVSRSATFERHSDAKAWAARVETEIRDGLQGNQSRNVFFGDILQRYLATETTKKRGKRSETYRINGILKSSLANIRVEDLRPQHFADWRDARLQQVSNDSVNRELSTLSAVCEHAMKEWSLLRENPVRKISKPKDLQQEGVKRIAVGNPASVPAGAYTQAALEKQKLWSSLQPKIVHTQNVRQALDYVIRSETEAGFVYRTDAALKPHAVNIVASIPTEKPVAYPIALTQSSKAANEAQRFVNYVLSDEGQRVLQRYGFSAAK